jgi:alkanesulfonate monooxygenase SsuD/methylene tetrahydromethanopterin reductase-like flavin-dependent oxidoreductase (luciferase family)
MQRITARFADEWNTWGTVASSAERHATFVAACEAVDVDPTTKWTSVQALVFLTDDDGQADRIRAGQWGERAVAGSVAHVVDELGAYAATGFDEFIVPDWNLGRTETERRDALERIHAEVLTQL